MSTLRYCWYIAIFFMYFFWMQCEVFSVFASGLSLMISLLISPFYSSPFMVMILGRAGTDPSDDSVSYEVSCVVLGEYPVS